MKRPPRPAILVAMSDVTQILSAIERGDPHAAEVLLPLVPKQAIAVCMVSCWVARR